MRTIPWIIIGILLVVIMFLRECTPAADCPKPVTVVQIDTVPGDTVPEPYPVHVPGPVTIVYDTTYRDVDTAAILRDYYAIRYYSDTTRNDTSFVVVVNDSVGQNKILWRQVHVQNLRPTAVNTITNTFENPPRTKLFLSGIIGGNMEHFGAGGGALLLTKKDHGYGYQYDAVNDMHYLEMHFKISLRKE